MAKKNTAERERIIDSVITAVASGDSLTNALKAAKAGCSTWFEWVAADSALAEKYTRARDAGEQVKFDGLSEIARDEPDVQRAKLMIETEKWRLGKQSPKKFGDRLLNEHTGYGGGPVQFERIERVIVKPPNTDG